MNARLVSDWMAQSVKLALKASRPDLGEYDAINTVAEEMESLVSRVNLDPLTPSDCRVLVEATHRRCLEILTS